MSRALYTAFLSPLITQALHDTIVPQKDTIIKKTPPWYKSWYIYVVYFAIGALGIIVLYLFLTKDERTRQNAKLRQLEDELFEYASQGEKHCHKSLQHLFPGYKFIKCRPGTLKNPLTQKRLELDFYCKELMLAIEYNGQQHYKFCPIYHDNPSLLDQQKARDKIKAQWCIDNSIVLVVVPYNVSQNKITNYIKSAVTTGAFTYCAHGIDTPLIKVADAWSDK